MGMPSRARLRSSEKLWKRRHTYRHRKLEAWRAEQSRAHERWRRLQDIRPERDPARVAAFRAYDRARHLVVKWERLRDEASDTLKLLRRKLAARAPMRERAYQHARADLDVREHGGNNRGPEVERIIREAGGYPGEPWCGDAVFAWYKRAGSRAPSRAWAYVPTLEKLLTRVLRPKRGHVVIFNFDGGVADHTGLFVRWIDRKAGRFLAIEGNTRPGTAASDSGGGEGVYERERHISQVQSFRRVPR